MPVSANSVVPDNVSGVERTKNFTYTGPSSYATGGEALTPATLGFQNITAFQFDGPASTGVAFSYNYSTQKVQAFWTGAWTTAMQEVTNATNLSTSAVRVKVWGV